MLSEIAIKEFLLRPRADFSVYKQLSEKRLEAIAARNQIDPKLWNKLRRPQKIMMLIGLRQPRMALFADTGIGKTITILALAQHYATQNKLKHVLVLVPRKANKTEWEFEIQKHVPGLKYLILPSETEEKWRLLENSDATVVIETYAGLYYLACDKVPHKNGKSNRMKPSPAKVKALQKHFDGLICDESHQAKGVGKLPYRLCRALAKKAWMVFILTGTPHGRDPVDLWAQMMIVDGGKTLGETLTLFRSVFFSEQRDFWAGKKYVFHKHKSGILNTILNNRSIRFRADEADLPKLVPIKKYVILPDDAMSYYRSALNIILAGQNRREMKNAWLRMRQISSGFVGYHDDDTGTTAEFEFPENPKLDLLLSILEGLTDKAIVFHEYTWSGLRIAAELRRLGIKHAHLHGGSPNQHEELLKFRSPGCKVLVMQNQFGEGLNLQLARYVLYYESPISPITRKQCTRRVERQGSSHETVFTYDLICKGTVDERILDALEHGFDLFDRIIEGKGKHTPRELLSDAARS
jgi:SNF2 family DNA or RNA helicase